MLNFSALYAMADTVEMMLEIGTAAIEARVLELGQRVREIVKAEGADVLHEGSPIVSAGFADAPAIAAKLKEHGIITAARHGRLRVSPHFYNDEADLERFAGSASHGAMSYSDNLENTLKALEGRDQSGPEDRRQRDKDRAAAIEAAPWAEKLKTGPWTVELLKQAARLGP